jgi:hypothetical protein
METTVPDFPAHPDTGTAPDAEASTARPRRKTVLWAAVIIVVLALFIVLHLTGVVGAESHK